MSEYIKRPDAQVSEQKIEELRHRVAEKVNKWADRIVVSMAFTPKIERQEGEQWTEEGKTYVIKNGVKQTVSALQAARMPFWCPRCSKSMSHRLDRKFYYLRGWCFDCNINVEHVMRLNGTFEAFERFMVRQNQKAIIKAEIEERLTYLREFKGFENMFQDGRFEMLATREDFGPMLKVVEESIEELVQKLEDIVAAQKAEEELYGKHTETPKDVAERLIQ